MCDCNRSPSLPFYFSFFFLFLCVRGVTQGGVVSAHILNSYFSCADANTQSGRLHTSVGSPYYGSTGCTLLPRAFWRVVAYSLFLIFFSPSCCLSCTAASYVELLGGCSKVTDLTVDGGALWAAGVSAATWAKVPIEKNNKRK